MKKTFLTLTVLTAFTISICAVCADSASDTFARKLKICSQTSYVYKTADGKALKRRITGVQPGAGSVACQYEQDLADGTTLKCDFNISELGTISSAFKSGQEGELLKNFLDQKLCRIE